MPGWCLHILKKIPGQQWCLTPVIPALWEAEEEGSLESMSSRLAWAVQQVGISTNNLKVSQVWWCEPVDPATQEAAAAGLLELGVQGCSEL